MSKKFSPSLEARRQAAATSRAQTATTGREANRTDAIEAASLVEGMTDELYDLISTRAALIGVPLVELLRSASRNNVSAVELSLRMPKYGQFLDPSSLEEATKMVVQRSGPDRGLTYPRIEGRYRRLDPEEYGAPYTALEDAGVKRYRQTWPFESRYGMGGVLPGGVVMIPPTRNPYGSNEHMYNAFSRSFPDSPLDYRPEVVVPWDDSGNWRGRDRTKGARSGPFGLARAIAAEREEAEKAEAFAREESARASLRLARESDRKKQKAAPRPK